MAMQLFIILADISLEPTDARTFVMGIDNTGASVAQLHQRAEATCSARGMVTIMVQPVPIPNELRPLFDQTIPTWENWYYDLLSAFRDGFTEESSGSFEEYLSHLQESAAAANEGGQTYCRWYLKMAGRRCRQQMIN